MSWQQHWRNKNSDHEASDKNYCGGLSYVERIFKAFKHECQDNFWTILKPFQPERLFNTSRVMKLLFTCQTSRPMFERRRLKYPEEIFTWMKENVPAISFKFHRFFLPVAQEIFSATKVFPESYSVLNEGRHEYKKRLKVEKNYEEMKAHLIYRDSEGNFKVWWWGKLRKIWKLSELRKK